MKMFEFCRPAMLNVFEGAVQMIALSAASRLMVAKVVWVWPG